MSILTYVIRRFRKRINMKNERRHGKSMRNGNAPAPYTKYKKKPYIYSFKRMGKIISINNQKENRAMNKNKYHKNKYLEAAE